MELAWEGYDRTILAVRCDLEDHSVRKKGGLREMRLVNVTSSMIASVGFDPDQEVMVVQFQNGRVYRYNGVPSGVFVSMLTDRDSVGKAFNAHVRAKKYPFSEIDLKQAQAL